MNGFVKSEYGKIKQNHMEKSKNIFQLCLCLFLCFLLSTVYYNTKQNETNQEKKHNNRSRSAKFCIVDVNKFFLCSV